MTPITTTTPLPDFEAIFRQIVGEAFYSLSIYNSEEWFSLALDQTQKEDQLLLEAIKAHESGLQQNRNTPQWESLKRKLSQTN